FGVVNNAVDDHIFEKVNLDRRRSRQRGKCNVVKPNDAFSFGIDRNIEIVTLYIVVGALWPQSALKAVFTGKGLTRHRHRRDQEYKGDFFHGNSIFWQLYQGVNLL